MCRPESLKGVVPSLRPRLTMASLPWVSVARLWDNCAHSARRQRQGIVLRLDRAPVRVYVSRRDRDGWTHLMSQEYRPDGKPGKRNSIALGLFDRCRRRLPRPLLLLTAPYSHTEDFLQRLYDRNTAIAAGIQPRAARRMMDTQDWSFLSSSDWRDFGNSAGALLKPISVGQLNGCLFVFDTEPVDLPRRGTNFVAYFGPDVSAGALALVSDFSLPTEIRSTSTEKHSQLRNTRFKSLPFQRPNTTVAVRQDNRISLNPVTVSATSPHSNRRITFADMFAGAGGLSLGFLTARNAQYELVSAVDISPICITTLNKNLSALEQSQDVTGRVNSHAIHMADIAEPQRASDTIPFSATGQPVDVLVGGPPCQPFSSARRRPSVPSEAGLVDSFCRIVEQIQPSIFLLENVQGILWQLPSGISPAVKMMGRMARAGYRVATRVLDAVWFGAPQHRPRAFIIGLHPRLGNHLRAEDAFPLPCHTGTSSRPYNTVADAIVDLPPIPNGHSRLDIPVHHKCQGTNEKQDCRVFDHVTSRHADYVINRFRRIRPGENWTAIRDMMTNYSRRDATHSNIYRRLEWDKPSVTLGHYRKSMLVHPEQDRGLSLREALRLQSFPDWYRLWGHPHTLTIGLDRKQQQLANAVPPVLGRALAERIAEFFG